MCPLQVARATSAQAANECTRLELELGSARLRYADAERLLKANQVQSNLVLYASTINSWSTLGATKQHVSGRGMVCAPTDTVQQVHGMCVSTMTDVHDRPVYVCTDNRR